MDLTYSSIHFYKEAQATTQREKIVSSITETVADLTLAVMRVNG